MSNLLRRAVKIAIWPAMLMIVAKFLSIFIISTVCNYGFNFDTGTDGLFSVQIYYSNSDITLFVNSYSNLVMLLVLAIPTYYSIIKTTIYQTSLQNPRTVVKLTKINILKWITRKDVSFLQIFIWDCFLLLSSAIILAQTLQGDCYTWIGVLAGALSLVSIWGTVKTYDEETAKLYPKEEHYY